MTLRRALRRLRLKPGDTLVVRDIDTYSRIRGMAERHAFQINFSVPILFSADHKKAIEVVHQHEQPNFNARQWVVQCQACGWLQIRSDFDTQFGTGITVIDDPRKLVCPRCGDGNCFIHGGLGAAR